MRQLLITIAAFVISLAVNPIHAQQTSSMDAEFLQLREKRDKALATVSEPINAGYRASLEQLMKRAEADGNNALAAKIQSEIQAIGAAVNNPSVSLPKPTFTPEMAALKKLLSDTKWRINDQQTFTLHEDGSSNSNWTPRKGRWKVLDGTTVELDVGNIKRQEKVAVSQDGVLMTWLHKDEDKERPQMAKKIVPLDKNKPKEPGKGFF